jgi:membrane protein YdbS with pleckstrin-like domain
VEWVSLSCQGRGFRVSLDGDLGRARPRPRIHQTALPAKSVLTKDGVSVLLLLALSIAAMMVSWFVWRRTEALAAKIATLVYYLVALIIFVKMPNPPNIGNWLYPIVLAIVGLAFWFDPKRKR